MTDPCYVCGHSAAELDRLRLQGEFFEEITRNALVRAGVARGMRVLDVGCGAGDVSLLAGTIVGPEGEVLGIDRSAEAVALASSRARLAGLPHVRAAEGAVASLAFDAPFDAVVGRFVLMHQEDPAGTLRSAVRHLRQGGIAAFLESHMAASVAGAHSHPHSVLYDRVLRAQIAIISAAGAHVDMGLRLRGTFLAAGLPAPALWLQARVEGGPDAAIYAYMAESLRSMAAAGRRLGVEPFDEAEIDGLAGRLREETVRTCGVLTSPLVVAAWTRGAHPGGS